ncbi:hypothetical protein Pmani_025177 [Petrolisthes manimaculis]|uniref:Transmembrane protein 254 n=1 Tax=Petrolisthes manimaculis TaxID=1843537 RepID=A0AAE1P8H1_9EUCA|nr:hypothetical protein Pmani_035480 [Petrolisthes manimaculis]KAK4302757.1 hypothetical protein Pmani_025177 [Petrolisthes manimaculis]
MWSTISPLTHTHPPTHLNNMAKARKVAANYFKIVNPIFMILTAAALAFLVVTYVDHKLIKPDLFGPIAGYAEIVSQYRFYLKISLLAIAAMHLLEALVAVYKCYKYRLNTLTTIAWTIQTVLFGLFSLIILLWPSKGKSQQQQGKQQQKQKSGGKQKQQQNNKKAKQSGKPSKSRKDD